jgi:two-component system phosphate regulon sensor histidine kinase PhoR
MPKKISLLIIASIIGLIALSLTQAYLFKNTYTQKKMDFLNKANQTVSRIDDYTPEIDSINDTWQKLFIKELDSYSLELISSEKALAKLRKITDSLNSAFKTEYDRELTSKNLEYNLKFHKMVQHIILVDSTRIDTIFKKKSTIPFRLLGHDFENNADSEISNSVWHTERSFTKNINGEPKHVAYQLYFETQDHINVAGWHSIILKSMFTLLLLSFLIFTFVISLLYYSINSLIRQKKITNIKTDFVNNITHELKTPLATLSLATKMLRKSEVKKDLHMVDATVSTIERQNVRLQKLIDEVLNNSLGYNEIELQKEKVLAKDYINTLLDDFLLSVASNEIEIERFILKEDYSISVDKFYFTTAILNILENAIKYGGTTINVDCKIENGKEFILSFSDNGQGISKKDQKLLFDKFFRVDTKEIHDVKGLGLGLYYSNQIVKAHKGTITVDSNEGKGSTFTMKVPII